MNAFPLLSAIVFVPLLGALLALAASRKPELCRRLSLLTAGADLLLVLSLFTLDLTTRPGSTGSWLRAEDLPWIESLGVRYSLGLDGLSLILILLTAFLFLLCVLVSWKQIETRVGPFHFFLLVMQCGIQGVFLSTDLFLFYLFWEVQLIPMFFLIGVWGHERRLYATVKFVLFTVAGSLLMLLSLIGLVILHGSQTGEYTFALSQLTHTPLAGVSGTVLYAAFLLAFGIKIPLIPVHTWLPDAHTEAPTAGSVILAGLLLKTGAYGLLRIAFPLFPAAAAASAPLLLGLGLAGLVYASLIALAQKDIKRLVAYSSVAHMALVVIGVAVWNRMTLTGSLLQLVNHGLTTSALFILVGILDERVHSRSLADLGGLWKRMPVFSAFLLFFAMASLGLPGLNNFVGELLILVGAFQARPAVAVAGFAGLMLTLVYVLHLVQEALLGEARQEHDLSDLSLRELAVLAPLAAAVLFIGLHPGPVLDLLQEPVQGLLRSLAGPALQPGLVPGVAI